MRVGNGIGCVAEKPYSPQRLKGCLSRLSVPLKTSPIASLLRKNYDNQKRNFEKPPRGKHCSTDLPVRFVAPSTSIPFWKLQCMRSATCCRLIAASSFGTDLTRLNLFGRLLPKPRLPPFPA